MDRETLVSQMGLAGVTSADLARELEVSEVNIYWWRTGRHGIPEHWWPKINGYLQKRARERLEDANKVLAGTP